MPISLLGFNGMQPMMPFGLPPGQVAEVAAIPEQIDMGQAWIRRHFLDSARPARNQRERRAAPAVEPAADIDIGRRIDAADADQTDKQPVPDIKRPRRTESRYDEPDRNHRRAKNHRPADADPFGNAAHQDAANTSADPHQGAGKCGD